MANTKITDLIETTLAAADDLFLFVDDPSGTPVNRKMTFQNVHTMPDAVSLIFGSGDDAGMRWDTGDASNHVLSIGLGNASQQLHITDFANLATPVDWARSAGTHPEVAIHSNTTPITDYLALGNHDGTTAHVNVVGGTTLSLEIDGTVEATLTESTFDLQDNAITTTGSITAATLGGPLDVNNENLTNVDIDSGAIDGTTIGTASAAAGEFTTLGASGLISADGGQIAFPSTQNASAGANTLDEYEEGTWTPTLQDNTRSNSESQTYANQNGRYTRIGNFLYWFFNMSMSSLGSLDTAEAAVIAGFPFTSRNESGFNQTTGVAGGAGLAITDGDSPGGIMFANDTVLNLIIWGSAAGHETGLISNVSANGIITMSGSHEVI